MTRYPKTGKGTKWTVRELAAIPPEWAGDSLNDSEGLTGEVRLLSSGLVSVKFKFAFKWQGKVAWYQCGTFPTNDMTTIRANRNEAKEWIRQGIDPRIKKQADKILANEAALQVIAEQKKKNEALTSVQDLFDTWIINGPERKDGNQRLRADFTRHVLPVIGNIPIKALTKDNIRSLLRKIVARGSNRVAVMMLKDLQQMFRWAEHEQPYRRLLVDGNPTHNIKIGTIVEPDYDLSNERDRVLVPEEILELRCRFHALTEQYESATDKRKAPRPLQIESQLALWLCLSTCCRVGELLMAEWQHVDLEQGTWRIPRENFKRTRTDKRPDYMVFLSDFSKDIFKRLHKLSGETPWVFPAKHKQDHVCIKSLTKQVGDRQVKYKNRTVQLKNRRNDNSLVLTKGEDREWTPHDLRRTGSTMMQSLGVSNDVRNLCLNHAIGDKIDRTYGVYEFQAEKTVAWQRLGKRIAEILGSK